jgi:hypothetical protein
MKIISLLCLSFLVSCSTIHFRSNHTIPVTLEGNPLHQKKVEISGKRDFYFWGTDPDYSVVFVDEEVKRAGYPALSKVIMYESKEPSNILVSFLTFGIYMPTGWTITGFTEGIADPDIKP